MRSNSSNRNRKTLILRVTVIACFGLGLLLVFAEWRHFREYGHLVGPGLHADVLVLKGDIGIEGISKLYEARVTNWGVLPTTVLVCDFEDPRRKHGLRVAYTVERWNVRSLEWDKLAFQGTEFCRPEAAEDLESRFFRVLLWAGRSVSTGREATAARDGLQLGDTVRFSVFLGEAGDWRKTVSTSGFSIDEHPIYSTIRRM